MSWEKGLSQGNNKRVFLYEEIVNGLHHERKEKKNDIIKKLCSRRKRRKPKKGWRAGEGGRQGIALFERKKGWRAGEGKREGGIIIVLLERKKVGELEKEKEKELYYLIVKKMGLLKTNKATDGDENLFAWCIRRVVDKLSSRTVVKIISIRPKRKDRVDLWCRKIEKKSCWRSDMRSFEYRCKKEENPLVWTQEK